MTQINLQTVDYLQHGQQRHTPESRRPLDDDAGDAMTGANFSVIDFAVSLCTPAVPQLITVYK